MASIHQLYLPSKVFNIDVKNHVASHKLIRWWRIITFLWNFEGYLQVLHLFLHYIMKVGNVIILIDGISFFNGLMNIYIPIVVTLVVPTCYLFTAAIIRSHFFSMCGTRQLNAGSWSISWDTEKSDVCNGCNSLIPDNFYHVIEPSYHW